MYKAIEKHTRNLVAVKYLSLSGMDLESLQEWEFLENLDHPRIVQYYGHFKDDQEVYIVLE
jgi:serine/threonine protein kinase